MATPAGSEFPSIDADEGRRQLEKIVQSASFRNSAVLQRFLEHVVQKSIQGHSHEIKEYEIAVEVLGKPSDFDPRLDTTVRAQAHRLREKLQEYYSTEGAGDSIRIELPKGHYIPQFTFRNAPKQAAIGPPPEMQAGAGELSDPPPLSSELSGGASRTLSGRLTLWLGLGAVAVAFFVAGLLISPSLRKGRATHDPDLPGSSMQTLPPSLKTIWGDFLQAGRPPLVAYSNSIFLVTETSDLLRLNAADVDGLGAPANGREMTQLAANPALVRDAGPVFFDDDHTGTGEVMAVYYLTRLFSQARVPLSVQRSQLVKTGDIRTRNVIFLGSVTENPILAGFPQARDFVISQPSKPPTLWRNRIVNLHPRPGEPRYYGVERDKQTQVLRTDYALISFLPGVSPGRRIAILAGLTTIGTQAAAQFLTSESGAAELIARLAAGGSAHSQKRAPQFFQAVLKVSIEQDEILSMRCVAVRAIRPGHQAG